MSEFDNETKGRVEQSARPWNEIDTLAHISDDIEIGAIPMTKPVTPTCDHLNRANRGDVVEIRDVLYRVDRLTWIARTNPSVWSEKIAVNQRVELSRMKDGKRFVTTRSFWGYSVEAGHNTIIRTPDDLIGTEHVPGQFAEQK